MAAGAQRLAQLVVVVDLAVEDHLDGAIFVADRLLPAGDIDDRQAAHSQRDFRRNEIAAAVRPPVDNCVAHGAHGAPRLVGIERPTGEARDATHRLRLHRTRGE